MRTHADAPGCTRSSTPQSSAAHEQVLKPVQRQTLFPQPSVESLDVRVLHWLAGLNVHQLDLPFHAPRQKMPARPLRPVVAANCFRPSALAHDPLQYSCHSPTVETGVHFQHSRVYASTTLSTRITRPHSTTSCTKSSAHSWFAAVRASSGCPPHAMFPLLPRDHHPCLPINPTHSLVVHMLSRVAQQNMQSRYAKRGFSRANFASRVRNGSSRRLLW